MSRCMEGLPQTIDRYELVERIGMGGMAQVWRARLTGIGGFAREVALKVLLPEYASEPDFVHMLLDEARIAGAIQHPCVMGMLDVGRNDDLFYLVMEYVDGGDLRAIMRVAPGGRVPLEPSLQIIAEVLRGLHAVHSAADEHGNPRKIVHRDVSPANVLLGRRGEVKLGDFGIAHASSRITRTRPGAVKGKLRYMAPEQISSNISGGVDHRADLYAVGIVLCELLLGTDGIQPSRMTPLGPVFAWSRRLYARRVPDDIAAILDRACAEDPRQRFGDAAEFKRAVVAALHRRKPGYGAEELARELGNLRSANAVRVTGREATVVEKPSLHELLDVSDEPEPTKTTPVVRPRPVEARALDATPMPPPAPYPVESEPAPSLQRKLPVKALALVTAASAAVLTFAIVLLVALRAPAAPNVVAPADGPRWAVAPLAPPKATTGVLAVEGPPGTVVTIGSTVYPAAPCQLELPAGRYTVKLRKRRARSVTREVTIEAGRSVALRL